MIVSNDLSLRGNALREAKLDPVASMQEACYEEACMNYIQSMRAYVFHDGLAHRRFLTDADSIGFQYKDNAQAMSETHINPSLLVPGYFVGAYVLAEGDRVLLIGQSPEAQNGLYVCSANPVRASDMDAPGEFGSALVYVEGGGTYVCASIDPEVGISPVRFIPLGGGGGAAGTATETAQGIAEIATQAETDLGADDQRIVTPLKLNGRISPMLELLQKLTPPAPQGLAGRAFGGTSALYEAKRSETGVLDTCTDDPSLRMSMDGVYNADSGSIAFFVDGVSEGSRALTGADDTGLYGAMRIVSEYDSYAGVTGREGFYKSMDLFLGEGGSMAVGAHDFRLSHSETGDSQTLAFYVDDPSAVSFSGVSFTAPAYATAGDIEANWQYASGVPSPKSGAQIGFNATLNNAVRTHFHKDFLCALYSEHFSGLYARYDSPPVLSSGASVAISLTAPFASGAYSENAAVSYAGYNSMDLQAYTNAVLGMRIDTVSANEHIWRIRAGSGAYPATIGTFWTAADSAISLKTTYTEELQLLNGKFQRPTVNHSLAVGPPAPDYSTGMGSGVRYYAVGAGPLTNASGFYINFAGAEGAWPVAGGAGLTITAIVKASSLSSTRVTNWIDCNAPYSGVGQPGAGADGSADNYAMVLAESGNFTRKCTFGTTPRSGWLIIRVGLPSGSTIKFSGATVTPY